MLSIISSIADGKNKMHYIVVDGMDTSFSDTNVEIGKGYEYYITDSNVVNMLTLPLFSYSLTV